MTVFSQKTLYKESSKFTAGNKKLTIMHTVLWSTIYKSSNVKIICKCYVQVDDSSYWCLQMMFMLKSVGYEKMDIVMFIFTLKTMIKSNHHAITLHFSGWCLFTIYLTCINGQILCNQRNTLDIDHHTCYAQHLSSYQ